MQQPRKQKKVLKEAFRGHDPAAARLLLAHSVALGHERLGVRRYLAAKYLGSEDLDQFRSFCIEAVRRFKSQELLASAATVARELHATADVHAAISDLMATPAPLVLPYAGVWPDLKTGPRYCGARVGLLGRLEIGSNPWFGAGTVVRGDGHFVRIGDDFRIGGRSTVHISHDRYPTLIGDRLTAGRNVVIHGCTVGSDCVIEDGAIVLDGSVVEDGVVIEANATVYPRSELKSGWVYSGSPAQPRRQLDHDERERRAHQLSDAIFGSIFVGQGESAPPSNDLDDECFIAATAILQGVVKLGTRSGVFFGCELNGETSGIDIGADCNVQDNSFIDASTGAVTIGAGTTIGHNVDMKSCTIGAGSLIGIGCRLAAGTVVDEAVLLAAGSVTTPGQHLERGWLWGGRPARPIVALDDAKLAMMAETIGQYRIYGAHFSAAQQQRSTREE